MSRKSILELSANEATKFFLKHESYCNIDLPKYFSFSELLEKISNEYSGKLIKAFKMHKTSKQMAFHKVLF